MARINLGCFLPSPRLVSLSSHSDQSSNTWHLLPTRFILSFTNSRKWQHITCLESMPVQGSHSTQIQSNHDAITMSAFRGTQVGLGFLNMFCLLPKGALLKVMLCIHASTLVNIACIIDVVSSTHGRTESGRVSFLHFLRTGPRRSYNK